VSTYDWLHGQIWFYARCFFDLLVVPLSYTFGGRFKSTYPPISLEYWPLEAMKPSILALEPSLTYTLIGLWCKLILKMLLITFFKLLFLKMYEMLGDLWWALSLYRVILWCSFFSLLPTWITWRGGHHYWIIFRHEAMWSLRRFFICHGPLLNILRNHCVSPQLCFSIRSGWYPHCGPFESDYFCFWPPFDLVNLSWAKGQSVKVQALESIKNIFRHRDSSGPHFGHKWLTYFKCVSGFSWFCQAFFEWGFILGSGTYWWSFSLGRHKLHWAFCLHVSFVDLLISFRQYLLLPSCFFWWVSIGKLCKYVGTLWV